MGSYSEIATDAYILREVGDGKAITIFECPYCANQSIGYAKNQLELGKTSFFGFHFEPYPMGQEANRLKQLLESKGKTVNIKYFNLPNPPFCQLNQKARGAIAKAFMDSDTAIALCCMAGFGGIKSALPDSKVVHGMATLGTLAAYLNVEKGKMYLDKSKSKVVRFREMNPTA
ncbi:MAG: hypothetical protein NWE93_04530 [Candidatus Bathyarchaeota archaeon]|nr:hypothetical protein [Candidatus Bathyarchaeota archaeon]